MFSTNTFHAEIRRVEFPGGLPAFVEISLIENKIRLSQTNKHAGLQEMAVSWPPRNCSDRTLRSVVSVAGFVCFNLGFGVMLRCCLAS